MDNNILFEAKLIENKIHLNIGATHIPMLCYALKLLEIEIERRMVEQNIINEAKAEPKIIVPDNHKHSILDFVRRRGG